MLKKEDLFKVTMPNLEGNYWLAFLNDCGYKRVIFSKSKKAAIKRIEKNCLENRWNLDKLIEIEVVNLSDKIKEKLLKIYDEQLFSRLINAYAYDVSKYYELKKCLPPNFIFTRSNKKNCFSFYMQNSMKPKYVFCTLTKEEQFKKFGKRLDAILYPNYDNKIFFPKTKNVSEKNIDKIDYFFLAGYDKTPSYNSLEYLATFGGPVEFFFTELQNDIEIVKEIKTKKHTKKINEETLENSKKEKYDEEEKIRNAEELKKLEEYFA